MYAIRVFLIVCIGFLLSSCHRDQVIDVPEITDEAEIIQLKNSSIKGIPFPEGSVATQLASKDIIKILLPDEMYFVVKNEKGEVFRVEELGVRCTCSKGSGCSPVRYDGEYYCVMDSDCKTCSSKSIAFFELAEGKKSQQEVTIVGVMNEIRGVAAFSKTKGVFTITKGTKQYGITEDFFKCREVMEELNNMYTFIYRKNVPAFILNNSADVPANYVYIKMDFFGNNILVPVPREQVEEEILAANFEIEDGGKVTCSCLRGSGCKSKSFLGVKYCDAGNCSDCALKD